jgi:hypothetical protein
MWGFMCPKRCAQGCDFDGYRPAPEFGARFIAANSLVGHEKESSISIGIPTTFPA